MDNKEMLNKAFIRIAAAIGLGLVVFFLCYSNIAKEQQELIKLKSRYTFSVRIDGKGTVVSADDTGGGYASGLEQLDIGTISDIWIKEYIGQYTQQFVANSRALRNVKIEKSTVLNESENIVLVSFSAIQKNSESEYFSSWDSVTDNGRLVCEWVVQLAVDDMYDNTANVYATSIQTSEAYGIETYNASMKDESDTKANVDTAVTQTEQDLYIYEIKNQVLSVSYDGGEKTTNVPVDFDNLMAGQTDKTKLASGSYIIGLEKTAFIYGGITVNNKKVPLTLIFSDDKGSNWISAQISDVTGIDYYYVNFTDQKNGIIVIGYGKTTTQESSDIYVTTDGGENWSKLGSGPATNIINGVNFIDSSIGFFSYEYVDGMDSNIYMTRDGGKTFSKITLQAQELDSMSTNNTNSSTQSSAAAKLQWSDVFKEAQVPVLNSKGILILYVTQGINGTYNGGNTVAKYESSDLGQTWKYVEQVEKETISALK